MTLFLWVITFCTKPNVWQSFNKITDVPELADGGPT